MSRQNRSRLFGSRPARRVNQRAQLRQASAEVFEERKLLSAVMASADDVSQTAAEEQTARAEFQVRVTDTAGQPVSQVDVGDEFLIEIVAHDRFETPTGFFTAYADVTYNADLVEIAGSDGSGELSKLGNLFSNNTPQGPGAVSPVLATLRATATSSGILEIGTNPAESNAKELVVYGHPEIDLRDEADYGSFRLLIGSPSVALEASPSINDAEQKTEIVLEIDASGVQASDFSADGPLADISEGFVARRQSDGATIQTSVERVEVVTAGESVRVTLSIDEPVGGFGTDQNGTWDIQTSLSSGNGDETATIGSFDIDFEVVNIETSIRFEDASGAALSSVEVGQEFRIVISGQDLRDMEEAELLGLLSAAYDIQYDTDLIDATGLIHNYGLSFRGGNFNDADGLIQDAGGVFGTQAPGSSDPVDVVTVVAIARAKGALNVSATPSDSGITIYTPGIRSARDVRQLVQSGSASLEVVEGLDFTIDLPTVAENGGSATVTVTRGQFSVNEEETLDVYIGDSSELSGPASVTFAAGQRSVSFELHGVDDNILDGTQSVTVSVASEGRTRGSLNVEVTDHEELSLSVINVEVPENAGNFQLTLRRGDVDDLSSSVSVELSVPDELRDRIELPGDVEIASGEESIVISVGVNDNDVVDGNHEISITASAAGFVSATASITIIDVENPDVVVTSFEAIDDRIDDGTRVRFTLQNRGSGTATDFNVNIVHSDDATIGNADDQVRLTVPVTELGAGESVTLFADVDFDVQTLVERFIRENENTGDPGEDAMSQMEEYLAAVVNAENSSQNFNVPTDDVTALPFDVNGDDVVTPRDALNAISAIGKSADGDRIAFDTDNDNAITPLDAATVIGHVGLSLNEDVVEAPESDATDPIVNTKVTVVFGFSHGGGAVNIDRVARVDNEIWVVSQAREAGGTVTMAYEDVSDSVVVGLPSLPIRHFVRSGSEVFSSRDGSGNVRTNYEASDTFQVDSAEFEQQLLGSTETFYEAEKQDDVVRNSAPTIASIDDQELEEGETTLVTLDLSDSDTPLSEMSVTVTSSDESAVSVASVAPESPNAGWTLALTNNAPSSPTSVTVTVSDGVSESSTTFEVWTVIVDDFSNKAPTISSIGDQELKDGETVSLPFSVSDENTPLSELSIIVTSNDDSILPEGSIVVDGTGAERTLSLSPAKSGGPVSVTVTVNDGEMAATTKFEVTVSEAISEPSKVVQPIAHLTFDGHTSNSIEGSPNGRLSGSVVIVDDGYEKGAAEFRSGVINLGGDDQFKFSRGDEFTYAAWVKVDDTDGRKPVIGNYRTGIEIGPDERVRFRVHDGGFRWITSENPITSGKWHHIAGAYDADGRMNLYIDGELVESLETKGLSSYPVRDLTLGYSSHVGGLRYSGQLDDVKVFDKSLNHEQILAVSGKQSKDAQQPVNDHDLSAQEGTAAQVAQTEGISSLRFDGESDIAFAGNGPNLQIDNDLTVSTWINPSDVSAFQKFISKGDSGKSHAWSLGINAGRLQIVVSEDGVASNAGKINVYRASTGVSLGEWSQVTWTFKDGANHLYVNGDEVSLQQIKYGNRQRVERLYTGDTSLQLGVEAFGVANAIRHFNGEMAETSIWKSALSKEEVKQLHNDGVVPNLSNHPSVDQLVSWWSMEVNNEGTAIVDQTGGNPLSLIGLSAEDVVQDSGLRGAETTIGSADEPTHLNDSSKSISSDEESSDSVPDSSDVDDSPTKSVNSSKTSTGAPSHAVTGSKPPVTSSKSLPRTTSTTSTSSRSRAIPTGGTASRAASGTNPDSVDPQGLARDPSTGTGAASHAADVLAQKAIDEVFKDDQLLDALNGSRMRPIDTSGTPNGLVKNDSSNATGTSRLGGAKSQAAAYLDFQAGRITKEEYEVFVARFDTVNTDAVNRIADTSLAKG